MSVVLWPVTFCTSSSGTPAVSAVGAIGASLTLSLKRGGLILPLIILPLLAPAVIFGAGAVAAAQDDLAAAGALHQVNDAAGLAAFVADLLARPGRRAAMGQAAKNMEPFEDAYQATDWSQFEHLPLFRVANRMNAYNTYLLMEQDKP